MSIAVAVMLAQTVWADQAGSLDREISLGKRSVEQFFGQKFLRSFRTIVCTDRASFDGYMMSRWKFTSEPWMVATGVSDAFVILDPNTWKQQTVEHDGDDRMHVQQIVAHELTHVFHEQHNPTKDFTGADEIGWFIEGLATYVSGQLRFGKSKDALEAINTGKAPTRLIDAWSGRYRYGVCGSMVEYIDLKYGSERLKSLLVATSQAEVLRALNTTESDFISDWIGWVLMK